MADTPDNRETVQVNQPDIINLPETNWPDPLVDPSNKLRVAVTNGSNGTQTNKDLVSTSQQDAGEHQLAEGYGATKGNGPTVFRVDSDNKGKGSFEETSQQIRGEFSLPDSDKVKNQ